MNDLFKNSKNAEEQIEQFYKRYDYDIREYPVEIIYEKFVRNINEDEDGIDEDKITEWYVPSYQRKHIWDQKQQSRFIESLFLNLPIPYLYVSDSGEDGLIEIVDGSQRVRTIVKFIENDLLLTGLDTLNELEGMKFKDFSRPAQRRFKRKTLRTIELVSMDEESRRDLFNRLNTGGVSLNGSEKRYGVRDGEFFDLVKELAMDERFRRLCPISKKKQDRREYDEFVLRFFAYAHAKESFNHQVDEFLDSYLDRMNAESFNSDDYRKEFNDVMVFVENNFEYGFRKSLTNKSVPRIRFEALAVGVFDALKENPHITKCDTSWVYDPNSEFVVLTTSDASNSKPKMERRINFVKEKVLGE